GGGPGQRHGALRPSPGRSLCGWAASRRGGRHRHRGGHQGGGRMSRLRAAWPVVVRLAAATLLVGLAAGVPVGLARLGSPLPTHWPAWSGIFTDLRVGYVPAAALRRVAIGASWFAWAFLAFEIAAESASWLRHHTSRRSAALGPLQPLLAKLVATAVVSVPVLRVPGGASGRPRLAAATVAASPWARRHPNPL